MAMPVASPDQGLSDEQQQMKMAMMAAAMGQQGGAALSYAAAPPVPQAAMAGDLSGPESAAPPAGLVSPATSPDVALAHASYASQPGAQASADAQNRLTNFQNTPFWKKALVPALIGAGSALGAHSWGGRQLQENAQQDINNYIGSRENQRDSLVKQVEFAKQQQQAEYEADQRNRQQDILMAGNNQTKTLMSQIAAGSRLGVADIAGRSRENVADTAGQSRLGVAGINAGSRERVASDTNQTRLEVSKINAEAALNRFLSGQAREDNRQQQGFAHTDLKPTADEDRRADLAQAATGYADMLEDIATRRPELFGNLGDTVGGLLTGKLQGGRMTQLESKFGTNDPDVAALKYLREQLGITQMGAHSLRSAQAIGPIADSLANSFNDSADVVIGNMQLAKKGLQQFTGQMTRPTAGYPGGESTNITPSRTGTNPLTNKVQNAPISVGGMPATFTGDPNQLPPTIEKPLSSGRNTPVISASTIPVGGTYNGYKYLGGPRSDQKSWQKVGQ